MLKEGLHKLRGSITAVPCVPDSNMSVCVPRHNEMPLPLFVNVQEHFGTVLHEGAE